MKLVDTNIVIYFLEKNNVFYSKAKNVLYDLNEEIALSAVSYFEIFHGVSPINRGVIRDILENFVILDITKEIAEKAGIFMADFKISKQHKIDALIASTAIYYDIPLVTNNIKDFSWIKELKLTPL